MSIIRNKFARPIIACIVVLSCSQFSFAQGLTIGEQLQFGNSLKATEAKLAAFCKSMVLIDSSSTRFPLATDSEQHLICNDYQKHNLSFDKAAFVIADDKFVHLEAIGVNVSAVEKSLGKEDGRYLGMNIYNDGAHSYWLDSTNARLVWLHQKSKHPNLFSWHNPYLHSQEYKAKPASIELPKLFDFNSDLESLKPRFAEECHPARMEHHERIWLLTKPDEQIQINCFGYLFAGFERKFEAVFGDGKLQLIWVLTAKAEESRLRELLVNKWGDPELSSSDWEVYANGRISLRKDKPELLILSDEMIPLYRERFKP